MPPWEERLGVKCLLRPFNESETAAYVEHRLRVAGARRTIIEPDAVATLHELTHGIARQINRLCDLALLIGFAEERRTLSADHFESVCRELVAVAPGRHMPAKNIRVLVVDDSAVIREILCDLVREAAGMEVVGTASDGREALQQIDRLAPGRGDTRPPDAEYGRSGDPGRPVRARRGSGHRGQLADAVRRKHHAGRPGPRRWTTCPNRRGRRI